jgi:hypothetical protein
VWVAWTLAAALPFGLTALCALALGATGLLGPAPGAPVAPRALPVKVAALLAIALVFVLAWVWLRPAVLRLLRAQRDPSEPTAGLVVVLVAVAATICIWTANPYAAALLAPALHIWLFALAPHFRMRASIGVGAVLIGVLPVALVTFGLARSLGLGIAESAWQGLLLVAGGHISVVSVLLWSAFAGCGACALIVAARGRRQDADAAIAITVRGPASYAGPGSLGGTESALKR